MKHAAKSSLPGDVSFNRLSIIAAQITATEVVESAMPAILAWRSGQPSTNCAKDHMPRKGTRNDTAPMLRLARRFDRSDCWSISVPARNVSTPLPSMARKFVHSVVWSSGTWSAVCMLLTTMPAKISISATEMPIQTEIRLATNASPHPERSREPDILVHKQKTPAKRWSFGRSNQR